MSLYVFIVRFGEFYRCIVTRHILRKLLPKVIFVYFIGAHFVLLSFRQSSFNLMEEEGSSILIKLLKHQYPSSCSGWA